MNLVSIVDPSRLETEKRVGSVKHALGTIGVDLTGILGRRMAGAEGGRIEKYGERCPLPRRKPSILCINVCTAYSGRLQTLSSISRGPA